VFLANNEVKVLHSVALRLLTKWKHK